MCMVMSLYVWGGMNVDKPVYSVQGKSTLGVLYYCSVHC